ncbi:MAG TPA: hypothetical protein VFX15_13230, partial [Actinomycetes bacterium]|nr:hypothetical protein [Actinomycetes bacterium]
MYTRRNSLESSGQHWLVFLASLVTAWLAWGPNGADLNNVGAAVALGVLLVNAVAVTTLSQRAVRQGQTLVETMTWESVTTYVSLIMVGVWVATTGGLAAPTLFVAFAWAPYLGMSVELGYTVRGWAILVGGSVGLAGWYSHTWDTHWQSGVLVAAALSFIIGITYFYASDLYNERFAAEETEAAVSKRVEQISEVLVAAADGNLA